MFGLFAIDLKSRSYINKSFFSYLFVLVSFKSNQLKMPSMPTVYSPEFIALIESTLNLDPKKRPSVNKILRDPFIKKNIISFLERTKQK